MNIDQQKPISIPFNKTDLNQERADVRRNYIKNDHPFTKDEFINLVDQEFQLLANIPDIDQETMQHVSNFFSENRDYYSLISHLFPYQLYFQILLESPRKRVKIYALKHLSLFSQFSSFPFDELIESPCFPYMLDTLKESNKEFILSPIFNILTFLLKTNPEQRDPLLEQDVLASLSDKLISPKIPIFLETVLTILPELPEEETSQINFLYNNLLDKCTQLNTQDKFAVKIIENTIISLIHLLKQQFSPFDFSFINNYIPTLLSLETEMRIVKQTVRLIGFLPFPTIQYIQPCTQLLNIDQGIYYIHTLLKVYIRKHEEWINSEDIICDQCLSISELEMVSPNEKLLCLKAIFLYFNFNQIYDDRACDLLIQFITFADVSRECIENLISMYEKAEFEEDEKQRFIEKVEESIDDFQSVIDEEGDEDVCRLINYFLQEIEQEGQ